jgi:hypothetical protein
MYTTAFPIETNLVLKKFFSTKFQHYHKQPIIIDKRTQLMWFGFNFSDAKDYATIAQYQKTFLETK